MKIAIWSSYNYGNFGDDLMAIQFANEVEKCGATPIVYRLDKRVANEFGIQTTYSPNELMDNTDAVIIGGGALFTRESWKRVYFRKITRDFEHDFKVLYKLSTKKNIPIYPLSIGGDGGGTSKGIPKWHTKLFLHELCPEGTVRLPDCLSVAKEFGIKAQYYPDVVFAADFCFENPEQTVPDNKIHIGLNLRKTDSAFIDTVYKVAKKNKNICFHFIKTHLSGYNLDYEFLPESETENIKAHEYKNLNDTIVFFASLDLLITIKLHIGITSLSKGTPIISYNGKAKTKTFLKSIDANDAIWTEKDKINLESFFATTTKESLKSRFDWEKIEQIKKESFQHLQFVTEKIIL